MEAVVFDFDGVIVESEGLHAEAIRGALAGLGLELTLEEYWCRWVGWSDRDIFVGVARGSGRELDGWELGELARRKRERFVAGVRAGELAVVEGSAELVEAAARECRVGLCSGALGEEVRPVLERLGIAGLFGSVVTAEMVARSKPDPMGYARVAGELGVSASRSVAIEDTPTGLSAARGAGYRTVGVGTTLALERLGGADLVVACVGAIELSALRALVSA